MQAVVNDYEFICGQCEQSSFFVCNDCESKMAMFAITRNYVCEFLQVGGRLLEIDGDGAVLAWRFGGLSHVSSSVAMAIDVDETSCGQRIERSSRL